MAEELLEVGPTEVPSQITSGIFRRCRKESEVGEGMGDLEGYSVLGVDCAELAGSCREVG